MYENIFVVFYRSSAKNSYSAKKFSFARFFNLCTKNHINSLCNITNLQQSLDFIAANH